MRIYKLMKSFFIVIRSFIRKVFLSKDPINTLKVSIKNNIDFIQRYGLLSFIRKIISYSNLFSSKRELFIDENIHLKLFEKDLKIRPLISIVTPTYNTNLVFLKELMTSLDQQIYSNWQLCVADGDSRNKAEIKKLLLAHPKVKFIQLEENKGISLNTNEILKIVDGDYIALLDHDDILTKDALYQVVKALEEDDYEFIYSDRIMVDEDGKELRNPYFKPNFSPELFYSANYGVHLAVLKKTLMDKIVGLDPKLDGSQDWDLFLRAIENTNKVKHIERILYLWRISSTSVASDISAKPYALKAQLDAVNNHLTRLGIPAEAIFTDETKKFIKLDWNNHLNYSICILDNDGNFDRTYHSIISSKLNDSQEIIIASDRKSVCTKAEILNMKVINWSESYFTNVDNLIKSSSYENILFIDTNSYFINGSNLSELVDWLNIKNIGIIFPQFLMHNEQIINSVGQYVDKNKVEDIFHNRHLGYIGLQGSSEWYWNITAGRHNCFALRKSDYLSLGGFNDEYGSLAFLDYCLKSNKVKRNLYTPHLKVANNEKLSIISDQELFNSIVELYKLNKFDFYYNANLINFK